MKNSEPIALRGKWRLTAYHKGTKRIHKVLEGENIITTIGKELVGHLLQNREPYETGITYHAIGENDTPAPAIGDTVLNDEVHRKAVIAKTQSGTTPNEFTWSTFYTAGESSFDIEEAGLFGHDADATPGSGILFSHYLVAFDNQAGTFDLVFDYILTIG